jgi:hypothetical protein
MRFAEIHDDMSRMPRQDSIHGLEKLLGFFLVAKNAAGGRQDGDPLLEKDLGLLDGTWRVQFPKDQDG